MGEPSGSRPCSTIKFAARKTQMDSIRAAKTGARCGSGSGLGCGGP